MKNIINSLKSLQTNLQTLLQEMNVAPESKAEEHYNTQLVTKGLIDLIGLCTKAFECHNTVTLGKALYKLKSYYDKHPALTKQIDQLFNPECERIISDESPIGKAYKVSCPTYIITKDQIFYLGCSNQTQIIGKTNLLKEENNLRQEILGDCNGQLLKDKLTRIQYEKIKQKARHDVKLPWVWNPSQAKLIKHLDAFMANLLNDTTYLDEIEAFVSNFSMAAKVFSKFIPSDLMKRGKKLIARAAKENTTETTNIETWLEKYKKHYPEWMQEILSTTFTMKTSGSHVLKLVLKYIKQHFSKDDPHGLYFHSSPDALDLGAFFVDIKSIIKTQAEHQSVLAALEALAVVINESPANVEKITQANQNIVNALLHTPSSEKLRIQVNKLIKMTAEENLPYSEFSKQIQECVLLAVNKPEYADIPSRIFELIFELKDRTQKHQEKLIELENILSNNHAYATVVESVIKLLDFIFPGKEYLPLRLALGENIHAQAFHFNRVVEHKTSKGDIWVNFEEAKEVKEARSNLAGLALVWRDQGGQQSKDFIQLVKSIAHEYLCVSRIFLDTEMKNYHLRWKLEELEKIQQFTNKPHNVELKQDAASIKELLLLQRLIDEANIVLIDINDDLDQIAKFKEHAATRTMNGSSEHIKAEVLNSYNLAIAAIETKKQEIIKNTKILQKSYCEALGSNTDEIKKRITDLSDLIEASKLDTKRMQTNNAERFAAIPKNDVMQLRACIDAINEEFRIKTEIDQALEQELTEKQSLLLKTVNDKHSILENKLESLKTELSEIEVQISETIVQLNNPIDDLKQVEGLILASNAASEAIFKRIKQLQLDVTSLEKDMQVFDKLQDGKIDTAALKDTFKVLKQKTLSSTPVQSLFWKQLDLDCNLLRADWSLYFKIKQQHFNNAVQKIQTKQVSRFERFISDCLFTCFNYQSNEKKWSLYLQYKLLPTLAEYMKTGESQNLTQVINNGQDTFRRAALRNPNIAASYSQLVVMGDKLSSTMLDNVNLSAQNLLPAPT